SDAAMRYAGEPNVPAYLRDIAKPTDESLPDANSVAAFNLLRFANVLAAPAWRARAEAIFTSLPSLPHVAAVKAMSGAERIVITGDRHFKATVDTLTEAHAPYAPLRAVIYVPSSTDARARLARTLAWTKTIDATAKEPRTITLR
ncbi:MAG TPA: hypothetical protein VFN10_05065, partial [Thermoanaerobaculia bacterium]|nr:hypothetical protein [Thermoanaerobaculia bacterium]